MVNQKIRKARQGSKTIPSSVSSDDLSNSNLSGVAGDSLLEKNPIFNKLHNEDVWQKNDSYIVLGKDRNDSDISGYGGAGYSYANSIDIVVGRGSCDPAVKQKLENSTETSGVYIDPNFKSDAARIYISQKTDIDKYFNLNQIAYGMVGESVEQSGIGIKADSVRIMSREGTKIVTYCDTRDSNGFLIPERKGVDLISVANKETTEDDSKNNMQPIPKGENLSKALEDIAEQLDKLSGIVINFVQIQNKYNNMIALHTHYSPFYGITVPPSLDLQTANIEQNLKTLSETVNDTLEYKMGYLNKFKNDYLNAVSDLYINSRYHHLN